MKSESKEVSDQLRVNLHEQVNDSVCDRVSIRVSNHVWELIKQNRSTITWGGK
jgi:hypothetical protein